MNRTSYQFWQTEELSASATLMTFHACPDVFIVSKTASSTQSRFDAPPCSTCEHSILALRDLEKTKVIRTLRLLDSENSPLPCHSISLFSDLNSPSCRGIRDFNRMFRRTPVVLLPHQQELLLTYGSRDYGSKQQPPLLLYWSLGSGKTLATLSLLFSSKDHMAPQRTFIVCPKSMVTMWCDNLKTFRPSLTAGKKTCEIAVCSYHFFNDLCSGHSKRFSRKQLLDSVIVVDEVHMYRNLTEKRRFDWDVISAARSLILLSGTPIVRPTEFSWLISILGVSEEDSNDASEKGETLILSALKRTSAVHFYDPAILTPVWHADFFPTVVREVEIVPMTWTQVAHKLLARGLLIIEGVCYQDAKRDSYSARSRSLCNSVIARSSSGEQITLSPKTLRVVSHIMRDPDRRHVIYSQFLDNGILSVARELELRGVECSVIEGSRSMRQRSQDIELYNQGSRRVLLFTECGREGLNLMRTDEFHCFEIQWLESLEDQARARVIRYRSHAPGATVVLRAYVSCYPSVIAQQGNLKSALAGLPTLPPYHQSRDKWTFEETDMDVLAEFATMQYRRMPTGESDPASKIRRIIEDVLLSCKEFQIQYTVEERLLQERRACAATYGHKLQLLQMAGIPENSAVYSDIAHKHQKQRGIPDIQQEATPVSSLCAPFDRDECIHAHDRSGHLTAGNVDMSKDLVLFDTICDRLKLSHVNQYVKAKLKLGVSLQ